MTSEKFKLKRGVGKGEGNFIILSLIYLIRVDDENSR
jgi:hypothetical protein